MKKILVTGANGQLAQCIRAATPNYPNLEMSYSDKDTLNLENEEAVRTFFEFNNFDVCINTAAYTNVEKAESERDKAFEVNSAAAARLAKYCAENNTLLIHLSTDYVFDGKKRSPYVETDGPNPLNVYGESKLAGEKEIAAVCPRHFIFRTSWLYSEYGHNFLKTIQKHAKAGNPLTITTEQTGTPTNANDLAQLLLKCADWNSRHYGIYHFSNAGKATWYDFAKAILEETDQIKKTKLAKTEHYRTFAARPQYSVLDTKKVRSEFNIEIKHWRDSLKTILTND